MNSYDLYKNILNNIAVGVFTIDTDFIITSFNREAEKITGFSRKEAIGRYCYEILRADKCFTDCALHTSIKSRAPITKQRVTILDKKNQEIPLEITTAALLDEQDRFVGGVESFIDDSERLFLENKVKGRYSFHQIVSKDDQIGNILEILPTLATADVAVIFLGETGTGKDLFARILHKESFRSQGPFIKVNCAALPESLLEAELFGYCKGAFTDAKNDKPGRFQLAHGGTLLLDEIGEMPLHLQAKLLQVLEDKEFYPLGGTSPVHVDVRMVATTNRNLSQMVKDGLFRSDLYYRLKVAEIFIPPVRERRGDVPLLVDYFSREVCTLQNIHPKKFSEQALETLVRYEYPGNVRELRNIVEYAILVQSGGTITTQDFPAYLSEVRNNDSSSYLSSDSEKESFFGDLSESKSSIERQTILQVLQDCFWHKGQAASQLGISRTTLWRKMKKYELV